MTVLWLGVKFLLIKKDHSIFFFFFKPDGEGYEPLMKVRLAIQLISYLSQITLRSHGRSSELLD